jgi:hypothetical protein
MKRSTEWFIAGAMLFGIAIFFFIVSSGASQQEFWYGTGGTPPIQIAISRLAPFMIPILAVVGIVFCALGLKANNENRPSVPEGAVLPPPPSNTCPKCHHKLTFIEQYKAWYCFECKEYM